MKALLKLWQGLKLLFGFIMWPIGITVYIIPSSHIRLQLASRITAGVLSALGMIVEASSVYLMVTEHFWWAVLTIVLYVVLTIIAGIFALLCDTVEDDRGAFA